MAEQSLDEQWSSKEKQGKAGKSKGYEVQGVELISKGKECSEANRNGKE